MDDTERIRAYFTASKPWRAELNALRAILRTTPLHETFKWRSPVYTHGSANVATLWRLKDHCGLSFFKGVLLPDPEGILDAPGENSRAVRLIRFTDTARIEALEPTLKSYLDAAIKLEVTGQKLILPKDDIVLPEELQQAMAEDDALATAFEALTPGRQRGYALHFGQAKQPETRRRRIAAARDAILAGKGMHDR